MGQKIVAISGSQSGMGLAFRNLLEESGYKIIGIDLPGKGAEVEADLTIQQERYRVVEEIKDRCEGNLYGVIANAGIDFCCTATYNIDGTDSIFG
ncbi:hypothetical protein [Shivajiella indica]|uniref:SDR family NAD(P)-dependent oxidoreductase n=1 Tax=Shivajiella indica TaxID=872115 RepID=A0ABW5B7Y1_9BACT